MATQSSVLAWRIPGTVEPGGLPSLGSHRIGHDWRDLAAAAAVYVHIFSLVSQRAHDPQTFNNYDYEDISLNYLHGALLWD